jgi:Ca2+-binding RTX toxin-like protein
MIKPISEPVSEDILIPVFAVMGGTSLADEIMGTDAADTLNGLGGNDTLYGRGGNDLLFGDDNDDVIYAADGNDTVFGGNDRDFVRAGTGNDSLFGSSGVDGLYGEDGDDFISGGDDNDNINGDSGNDILYGGTGDDFIQGNIGNDTLYGDSGNDSLFGNDGNDYHSGGAGSDQYSDISGTDIFTIQDVGDVFVDSIFWTADETDTVRSFISYTLEIKIGRLGLQGTANVTGTGNSLNNFLSGNTGNNRLDGQIGSDTLDGNLGSDTLVGGTGNDVYMVDALGNVVQETSTAATEVDTVRPFIHYTLGANVERLGLQGNSNLIGNGNGFSNTVVGNIGANFLNGQAGNDSLYGGVGNDTLLGGQGNDVLIGDIGDDRFRYATGATFVSAVVGVDLLTDFARATGNTDKITLSRITFSAGTSFASVGSDALAQTSTAFITFSTSTGHLFYNQNSSAAGLGTGSQFATLSDINGSPISSANTLLASDFEIAA